jgi:LmbE family N-acetylglucosaminyl deacetylase
LLAIFAHPDDEILGTGGTIAGLAQRGVHVALVCATKGEAGEIAIPELATPETLGSVREQEMRCSAAALGISELIFLGYRDSGMAGTAENEHPDAYINAPDAEVVERLVGIIRRLRPDILLTFEPYGGYGHPDHIAVNRHTVEAYQVAGHLHYLPEVGMPWRPRRLFYQILPNFMLAELRDAIAAYGGQTDDFDLEKRSKEGWPDDQIHVICDVSKYTQAKMEAWECHRTQFGPDSRFRRLPRERMTKYLSKEYFALAEPLGAPELPWSDLFTDL